MKIMYKNMSTNFTPFKHDVQKVLIWEIESRVVLSGW
jgi:hypothetical protein